MISASKEPVVVVGNGLAGISFACALRQGGYTGELTLLSDEAEAPYDRPPLSKAYLKDGDTQRIRLDESRLNGARLLRGVRAEMLDLDGRKLTLSDGQVIPWGTLVLATGARPRELRSLEAFGNPAAAAYLQVLLLTGARPGEVLGLRWEDINVKWKGLTIRDKVEGERVIPLTPYVSQLLHALPRRKYEDGKPNPWLFSSATAADGRLTIPRNFHSGACKVAGIEGLTLHGLRRSFKSLTEWLESPAGVVAQIMGHKPSATAEKHYTVRPLDLLAVHHRRIEAWILEQAGVPVMEDEQAGKLRAVK